MQAAKEKSNQLSYPAVTPELRRGKAFLRVQPWLSYLGSKGLLKGGKSCRILETLPSTWG